MFAVGGSTSLASLINVGSRTPAASGLYHYTVKTAANTKEGTDSPQTVDIGFHYVGVNASNLPKDTDGEGAADYAEDRNGNGVKDSNETAIDDPDTDYDGRSDAQELADGTDPLDDRSAAQARLGRWRLNDTSWTSDTGAAPLESSGGQSVATFDGNGLRMNNGPSSAKLRYRSVESDGRANINYEFGTIRFMFKPDWSTTSGGPGAEAVLVQAGVKNQNGYWVLRINSAGNSIAFIQFGNGSEATSAAGPINWTSGTWYFVTLDYYGEQGSFIHVNGVDVDTGTGHHRVWYVPDTTVRAEGFRIGSDHNGQSQAKGTFDEFEIFNYRIGHVVNFQEMNRAGIGAIVSAWPPSIILNWRNFPSIPMTVKRRILGQSEWTTLATGYTAWTYTDNAVSAGTRYEVRGDEAGPV